MGAGEREGRIWSSLVRQRNSGFAHGVGRSGELSAVQPKAAGSSLLYKLTNFMVLDAIHMSGVTNAVEAIAVPLATGMALSLCLSAWSSRRPSARFVIWPRIDQKTCFKCILAAGLTPIVIENKLENGKLSTDLEAIEKAISSAGPENVLAVLSTSSCFAPRIPDNLPEIAKICKQHDIYHLVNNAYGLQSSKSCHMINTASKEGRLDAFVQSTDKNFLVPVGGAVISSCLPDILTDISQTYPGRASAAPIIDLFITLLSMGQIGYKKLLKDRKDVYAYFKLKLNALAEAFGERVVETPGNQISMAMTLDTFSHSESASNRSEAGQASSSQESKVSQPKEAPKYEAGETFIGSMLFNHCTSGIRVVAKGKVQKINGWSFTGYGSHHNEYPSVYLTVAAAVGMTSEDVDLTISRLEKVLKKASKKLKAPQAPNSKK